MPTLIDAFLGARVRHDDIAAARRDSAAAVASHDGGAGARGSGSMEAILAELIARGNAAHLDLRFNAALFAAHLGRCGAPVETLPAAEIHAEDLFLAAAALHGDQEAAAKLRRLYHAAIVGALMSIDTSAPFVDDVEQELWAAALVGGDGAAPELGGYTGQGALADWVAAAARRIAPVVRARDAADFRGALTQALVGLEDRERMIYRLHVANGMTVAMIAKVYRVSDETIAHWLAKARDSVIRETQRLLHGEVTLSPAEFESVAARVVSQLDLGVSQIVRDRM
jgi:RNA polymerase sigma-70 factor, ECF subfamily